MKKIIQYSAISIALLGSATAATIVPLTFNATGSSLSAFGYGEGGVLLTDTFAYDPDAPTSVLPDQTLLGNDFTNHFHGNNAEGVDVVLNFDLTALTTAVGSEIFFLDVYSRSNTESESDRDNNFDVVLLNGGVVVETVSGLAIPDADPAYARATFDSLALGTTFDQVRIVGHDSGDAANYFTLSEVRAGTMAPVPEPSSTALIGLGGLAFILRRRK